MFVLPFHVVAAGGSSIFSTYLQLQNIYTENRFREILFVAQSKAAPRKSSFRQQSTSHSSACEPKIYNNNASLLRKTHNDCDSVKIKCKHMTTETIRSTPKPPPHMADVIALVVSTKGTHILLISTRSLWKPAVI